MYVNIKYHKTYLQITPAIPKDTGAVLIPFEYYEYTEDASLPEETIDIVKKILTFSGE